jgi:hypothetical protein
MKRFGDSQQSVSSVSRLTCSTANTNYSGISDSWLKTYLTGVSSIYDTLFGPVGQRNIPDTVSEYESKMTEIISSIERLSKLSTSEVTQTTIDKLISDIIELKAQLEGGAFRNEAITKMVNAHVKHMFYLSNVVIDNPIGGENARLYADNITTTIDLIKGAEGSGYTQDVIDKMHVELMVQNFDVIVEMLTYYNDNNEKPKGGLITNISLLGGYLKCKVYEAVNAKINSQEELQTPTEVNKEITQIALDQIQKDMTTLQGQLAVRLARLDEQGTPSLASEDGIMPPLHGRNDTVSKVTDMNIPSNVLPPPTPLQNSYSNSNISQDSESRLNNFGDSVSEQSSKKPKFSGSESVNSTIVSNYTEETIITELLNTGTIRDLMSQLYTYTPVPLSTVIEAIDTAILQRIDCVNSPTSDNASINPPLGGRRSAKKRTQRRRRHRSRATKRYRRKTCRNVYSRSSKRSRRTKK